jgi:hypothetical protein
MSPADKIKTFISRCQNRFLGLEVLAGLCLLASMAAGIFLVGLIAAGAFSGESVVTRLVLRLLLAAGVLVLFWRYFLAPRLRLGSAVSVAREVEVRLFGSRNLELVGAVELSQGAYEQVERAGTSPELIEAHLECQAGRIAEISVERVFGRGRLREPLILLVGLLAACAFSALAWPDTAEAGIRLLLGTDGQTRIAEERDEPSWVGDLRLTYRYPAYSGRQERVVEGTDGAIVALPGTRVAISARSDRKIAKARLRLSDKALPFKIDAGNYLSTELTVTRAGRYRFDLADTQGHEWTDSKGHPIDIEVDHPPVVVLNQPAQDLEIRHRDKLRLLYNATDDFGLGEIRLVWRVTERSGSENRRLLSRISAGTRRTSRRSFLWDLVELRLEPGERLQFYIEATDNDTVSGPKVGRSATCNVKVFSADEHHRQLLKQVQSAWEGLLTSLADALDLEPQAGGAKAPAQDAYKRLFDGGSALLQKMRRLSTALRSDKQAPVSLVAAFEHVSERFGYLHTRLGRLLRAAPHGTEVSKRLLVDHFRQRISRLEQDVLYLEDLLDLVRLEEIDRLARDMEEARQRLSELMKRYSKAPDDETRRQIEAEIARLKDKIAKLLARQREVLKGVRDEYFNPDALRKLLSDSNMLESLDRIQSLLNQGKIDKAAAELQKLQDQLAALRASVERSRARMGGGRYQELAQKMMSALGELKMITESQRKLMDTTGHIRDRLFEKLKKGKLAALKKKFAKLRMEVAAVKRDIGNLPQEWSDSYIEQLRLRILQQARLLDMNLESIEISGSLDSAEKLSFDTDRLANEMRISRAMELPANREQLAKTQKTADRAARTSKRIFEELKKIVPSPEKLLGSREVRKIGRMGQRQQELRAHLRALERGLRQINEAAPLLGQGNLGRLERGGQHMQRAASALGRKAPGRAHSQQRGAVAELEALQKSLQKSCRGGSGGLPLPMGGEGLGHGMDMGGPGGRPQDQDVELPDPDEYRAPPAFREALLKGMKDPVPEAFKRQVRRYYEELVK